MKAADRRGLRRHAVHLQRLRAELAVARSAESAAAGGPRRPISRSSRSRRSRATARRSWISATCSWAADSTQVVGTMRNFIPERVVRATGTHDAHEHRRRRHLHRRVRERRVRLDPDQLRDGRQLSGLEARVYGSKGALICRLVEENGICEIAQGGERGPGRVSRDRGAGAVLPAGRAASGNRGARSSTRTWSARSSTEILSDGPANEGNFEDGAHVQELINAVERSFRERRWVSIPLEGEPTA